MLLYSQMSDTSSDSRGKLGFFLVLILIAGGSLLILFPAWLPSSKYQALGEDGAVEILQLFLLILSASLHFAAAPHAEKLGPIFSALGFGAIAAALGESAGMIEGLIAPVKVEFFAWPLFIIIGWKILRNLKAFSQFWGYASKKPASGFFLAGIIIAYVFGEVFGSKEFWQASLGTTVHHAIPQVVESYLELLACYFIFVSSLGFCLPISKRRALKIHQ